MQMSEAKRKSIERKITSLEALADPRRNPNAGERANARDAAARLRKLLDARAAGAPRRPSDGTAYCGRCARYVDHYCGRCNECERMIWELQAKINGQRTRSTSATYAGLVRAVRGERPILETTPPLS